MKNCSECGGLKRKIDDFHKDKQKKDGLSSKCKECCKKYRIENPERLKALQRSYYENHADHLKEYARRWRNLNKEKRNADYKAYRQENRVLLNKLQQQKYRQDMSFRLKCRLRSRLSKLLRGKDKPGSAIEDLGCSIDFLKFYLEKKFQPGMSWDNYGQWHVDHIKPLAKFDLTNREQFLQACHYTNLQPLWAVDNLKKRDLYSEGEQDAVIHSVS